MAQTITSPGVAVNEIDLSLRPSVPAGTSVLVAGFAPQGPTDEVFAVNSYSEFVNVYGKPTNPAERYFFQSAKAIFNSDARVLATRLPYGSGGGLGYAERYSALFFPVFPYDDAVHPSNAALPVSVSATSVTQGTAGNGSSLSGVAATADLSTADAVIWNGHHNGYILGRPTLITLDKLQYQDLVQSNFNWLNHVPINPTFTGDKTTWGLAGMIVVNKSKTAINERYEGHYLALSDNSQVNPATNFTSIRRQFTINENTQTIGDLTVPKERQNFSLSATPTDNNDSVSETLEELPQFDIAGNEFRDTIMMGLFRLRTSVFSVDTIKLDYALAEGYLGSLDGYRKLQNPGGGTPETFFLGDVEDGSPNIEVIVNPHISFDNGTWIPGTGSNPSRCVRIITEQLLEDSFDNSLSGAGGIPENVLSDLKVKGMNQADALLPLGTYQETDPRTKEIGSVPSKVSRVLRSIENLDLVNIDVSVEGGLGTIYSTSQHNITNGPADNRTDTFDDNLTIDIGTIDFDNGSNTTGLYQIKDGQVTTGTTGATYIENYLSVFNEFKDFAEFNRKDHMFVADAPRHIFVQGDAAKVMTHDKRRTFTQAVYWPLRHVFSKVNSSYVSVYGNWGRCFSTEADRAMWCPFSGYAAATLANNDAVYAPWYAPAGFTRGRFGGVLDLAVVPSQKQRDQLYKLNVNPVTQFPGEGFVIYGQKTMFRKPSAFDRVNVRRLFLFLEKMVRASMKYYVFEPNTLLTRTSILNNLTPAFENIRNQQGMYDYLIICDERNNTPDVIDNNQLVVDIYVKPVRAAEIILVNFYATRTGQDFSEIVS